MRKSTLVISAMLTMFLMATMFGVTSAYQQIVKNNAKSAVSSVTVAQPAVAATVPPVAQTLVVTPEQATTIAIDFLGDTNVYSVETVVYEGVPAYLVTFSSGDLVYVSSSGQILANTKLAPIVVAAQPSRGNSGNSDDGQTSNTSGGGEGEHESHESHDGGDD